MSSHRISCYPNAGLPNEEGKFGETPGVVGGAARDSSITAGSTSSADAAEQRRRIFRPSRDGRRQAAARHVHSRSHRAYYSGIELVEAEESNRPLIVGERTNVIGSRLFKNLVAEEKWEEATEIARRQVKNGAHIVDVCLQSTDRDEIKDIPPFYEKLIRKIKAPDHDRHDRPEGGGAGAHLLPGKEHHQFDQSGGWRREVRADLPTRQKLRCRDRGGVHRRRQAAGTGLHA